jgi:hypothetical protein
MNETPEVTPLALHPLNIQAAEQAAVTARHDSAVCRYPTLSALCPACARLWAEEIRADELAPNRHLSGE